MSSTEGGDLQPKTFFSFEWKIKRFFAGCEKVGDKHTSPLFPICYPNKNTTWLLQVYPMKGYEESCKDSISLYLCYKNDFTDVTVDLQLSIVGKQNSKPRIMKSRVLLRPRDFCGWCEFEKQDVIKNAESGTLIDDTLTIACEITFHPSSQNVSEEVKDYDSIINKIGTGIEEFEGLLESNCCSDVTFCVKDTTYGPLIMHLHRAILMCRSPVFHAMFEKDVKEKKKSLVEITNIDGDVMEALFRFIYTEKVQHLDDIAQPLLIAADKYSVTGLKALCERKLYSELTVDNAIEYLKLTEKCNTIHLKTLTVDFVADHYKDIVENIFYCRSTNSKKCLKIAVTISQKSNHFLSIKNLGLIFGL